MQHIPSTPVVRTQIRGGVYQTQRKARTAWRPAGWIFLRAENAGAGHRRDKPPRLTGLREPTGRGASPIHDRAIVGVISFSVFPIVADLSGHCVFIELDSQPRTGG